jgi:hypothetical protein
VQQRDELCSGQGKFCSKVKWIVQQTVVDFAWGRLCSSVGWIVQQSGVDCATESG